MAAPATQIRAPRPRTLSPADIGLLAEQAGRRNASRELKLQKMNASDTLQLHLTQNSLGTHNTSSPLAISHYPQQNYQSEAITYTPNPKSTRDLHVSRQRAIGGGLGYEFGLSSNMPSQLPRKTPQEAAVAARIHAERVKAMQSNLAADPNIMAQAPESAAQLPAQGPPLTGHHTTSTTTLPSVLQPYSRPPTMTYAQATQAIFAETGPLKMLLRLELLEPAPVTVLLYDDANRPLGVSEDLVLTKTTDLKALVTTLQDLLDAEISSTPGKDGGRFLLTHIEVRNGSEEMRNGHPALKGECRGGDKVNSAVAIRWITNGDMEMYWKVYRIVLQTQAPQPSDKVPVVKPIFRVKTVRQVMDSSGARREGHDFVEVLTMIAGSGVGAVKEGDRGGDEGGQDSGDTSSESSSKGGVALFSVGRGSFTSTAGWDGQNTSSSEGGHASKTSGGTNQPSFGGDAAASTPGSTNNGFSNYGGGSNTGGNDPKSNENKGKAKPVDPTRNWGYYQRMGGNPENHKKYDLSHVPFEVKDFPIPKIIVNPALEQEIVARIQSEGWNHETPRGSNPEASSAPAPVVYSAEEQAWRDKAAEEFERAISFEDDDSFFPNYDTQVPDAHKTVASRLVGSQQQNAKEKCKETESNDFFSGHCAPDGSQDHLIMGGVNSPKPPMAGTPDGNAMYSGYTTLQGGPGDMGGVGTIGSGMDGHGRNQGQAKRSDNNPQGNHSGLDPSQVRIDRIMSRYAGAFTNTPVNTKSPLAKASSMNVHAPEYRSNSTTLSPYLQSLAGPSPSYTQAHSYGQVQRSNSFVPTAAMDRHDGFITFSQPNVQHQYLQNSTSIQAHPSSSSGQNSQAKQYAINASAIGPVPQWKLGAYLNRNDMFNNSSGASSPEKAIQNVTNVISRPQSPERQNSRQGRGPSPRRRSPEKFNAQGYGGVPLLRHPSPEKHNTQQGQAWSSQYGQGGGAGQMAGYPHFSEPNFEPGFKYGQNSQYDFNFDFQPYGQRSDHHGGHGPL